MREGRVFSQCAFLRRLRREARCPATSTTAMAAAAAGEICTRLNSTNRLIMPGLRRADALWIPQNLPPLRRWTGVGAAPVSSLPFPRLRQRPTSIRRVARQFHSMVLDSLAGQQANGTIETLSRAFKAFLRSRIDSFEIAETLVSIMMLYAVSRLSRSGYAPLRN